MKIKVTKQDIKNGTGNEKKLEYCPIAFAIIWQLSMNKDMFNF